MHKYTTYQTATLFSEMFPFWFIAANISKPKAIHVYEQIQPD